jgi:hypothetical protein
MKILVCGCEAPNYAKGLCKLHYQRYYNRKRGVKPAARLRWTEAQIRELKHLFETKKVVTVGLSREDIARELSRLTGEPFTTSAVINKIIQLGLVRDE